MSLTLSQSGPAPIPTKRQLAWHRMEVYGFLHFTTNTFTDREWGQGDEPESVFAPTDFSADQIVDVAKRAGMKGLILTAKHHDGFCLWPTKTTGHNVSKSPFGKDVVRLVSDACRKAGLKFGVYLSPWDRHDARYGRPEYVETYRAQLKELLTGYGPIFEVWHDGANGGDGYYGGARETRKIDASTYYGWPETWAIVRRLQPDAVIFSDAGPDVRWVGNESGFAGDPCWATYTPSGPKEGVAPAPGLTKYQDGEHGHVDGQYWMPAECDVSIRPGWFWHEKENDKVKTPQQLKDLYFRSVGRGASFLLNVPPDRRGRIHPNDEKALIGFKRLLDEAFAHDLAKTAKTVSATNVRDGQHSAAKATDGDTATFWALPERTSKGSLEMRFAKPVAFDTVRIREAIALGQRIRRVEVSALIGSMWRTVAEAESVGNCRLFQIGPVTTTKVRFTFQGTGAAVSEIGLFLDPNKAP
ncbi:MAG: alpha-L-fucosidase [Armatimonadetes bacterium]|nr:alpha-L-fucosidase [Armatimonadota bacterium]